MKIEEICKWIGHKSIHVTMGYLAYMSDWDKEVTQLT